jgi:hypothetical protein
VTPLPPVTDPYCLQVELRVGDDASIQAGSRFFLSYGGTPPSASDLVTLADSVQAQWGSYLAPYVGSAESLQGVTITDLSSPTAAVGVWTGSVDGTASGELPASICTLINHHINRRYRGGRPRIYLRMGTTANLVSNNQWNSTYIGDALTAWEEFISHVIATTGIGITGLAIVNISYYEGFTTFMTPSGRYRNISKLRVGGPVVDNIVSSTVASRLGSQRRRLNV